MTQDAGTQRLANLSRHTLTIFVASIPVIAWALELGVALTASHLLAFFIMGLAATVLICLRQRPVVDLATLSITGFIVVATVTVVQVHLRPDVVILGESVQAKAIKQLLGLWFAFGLFAALKYLLETFRLAPAVLRAHFWTTVVAALLALLQFGIALWDVSSPLAALPVYNSTLGETRLLDTGVLLYGFPRVSLTLVEPSRLGTYLLTGWAFWLFALGRRGDGFLHGKWFTLSGVVLGAAIVVTGSRSAYIVFAALALGALVARPHRIYRMALVGASIFLASILIGPGETAGVTATLIPDHDAVDTESAVRDARPRVANPRVSAAETGNTRGDVLETIEDRLMIAALGSGVSERHRIGSMLVSLSVLREAPWLGSGYGTSEFAMAARFPRALGQIVENSQRPTMLGAYNTVISETGLLGALCLAGLALGTVLSLMEAVRSGTSQARALAWGAGAALAAYAIAMIGLALEVYQFLLVWMLLATALALRADLSAGVGGSGRRRLAEEESVHLQHAP